MPRLVATCAPGLEDLVQAELVEAGARVVPAPVAVRGRVHAEVGTFEAAARLLLAARIVSRLGVVVGEGRLDADAPFAAARRLARELDLDAWMRPGATFGVRAHRQGEQAFRSLDIARHLGGEVHNRYTEAWGEAPRVDLDDPDLPLRADVDADNRIVVWADLVGGASLHVRGYRVVEHEASLKATIACALLRMAGYPRLGPGLLVDPMTGGATIAIEAAWAAAGVPPVALRAPRLALGRAGPLAGRTAEILGPDLFPPGRAAGAFVAADRNPGHLIGARRNAERAGVADRLRFVRADAADLASYAPAARWIVANPPYGIRIGRKDEVRHAHRALAEAAAKLPGARVAVVTTRMDLLNEAAEACGVRVVETRSVMHGDVSVRLSVLSG